MPRRILRRSYTAFNRFMRLEIAAGAFLFGGALLAVAVANAPGLAQTYEHALHEQVGLILVGKTFSFSLAHFINDGLMAIFFLLVGLEMKRELLDGELSSRSRALLPAIAAAGGMVVPAAIYTALNWGDETALRGWAIPTATDIAFSLGVLSLLGSRVPLAIRVFLTAVAVIDDLGAIVIIALFYTDNLAVAPIMVAAFILFAMFILNRNGVCARWPYLLLGFALWVFVLKSGIHATLAGVATAFAVPLRHREHDKKSPLITLEHDLHGLVTFFVLPVFAFANAGVSFAGLSLSSLLQPLPLGIAAGLLVGKIIGVSGATFLAVKSGIVQKPDNCSWSAVVSISVLCGIGFTVSLFIGNLAFSGGDAGLINLVKLGVLSGSLIAGIAGYCMLRFVAFPPEK